MSGLFNPTGLVRPLAHRRLGRLWSNDPVAAQARLLRRLVERAQDTRFGRDHGFDRVRTIEDFQAAVPVRAYEAFWQDYWQERFPVLDNVSWPGRVPFFAVTSGTTSGRTKYIPLTRATLQQNHRTALDMLGAHLVATPGSRLFAGRSFFLGGSTALVEEAPGVWSGDLSGIAAKSAPRWMRPLTYPPPDVALMDDWDAKLETLAQGLAGRRITALSGVPAWVLVLFDRLDGLYERWPLPDLELLIHGGVAWAPYAERFKGYLGRSGAKTREVYPASEGFIAFQDRGPGEGLLLSYDTGLFFEFVPTEELDLENPTRHWLATVEAGVDYAVVLTSPSGLFSYVLGDTVSFLETRPPRLRITGRTAYMLSAFGEHLIQSELDAAVTAAVEAGGAQLTEYVAGPVLPVRGLGHHIIYVETGSPTTLDAAEVAGRIDQRLSELNDDYAAHRQGDVGMGAPEVRLLPPGTCTAWLRREGKLGGQHKVPRVIADAERFAEAAAAIDAASTEAADHT